MDVQINEARTQELVLVYLDDGMKPDLGINHEL
jgi:hypothetical protein